MPPTTDSGPEAIVARLRARIGLRSPPFTLEVEKGAIRDFASAIGDADPLCFDEDYARASRFGGLVAPPTFVSRFIPAVMKGLLASDLPYARNVHGEDVVESHRAIIAGDTITAIGSYADVLAKQGRHGPMIFQYVDIHLSDAKREPVAQIRISSVSY